MQQGETPKRLHTIFKTRRKPEIKNSFSVYYPDVYLPRTRHDYHHDMKVKPEAATAVVELLMMGGRTPETC